uniref:cupin-like domain-containing protein n=1 Tax=Microbulbifer agarilyticus TaxID=260552 RepID=UPI000255B952|nr:cupin-like domain-containing protein [Microbulbifer agarilyticus]
MKYPEQIPAVETRDGIAASEIAELIEGREQPLLLKGAMSHWPLVRAAHENRLSEYLQEFDQGRPVVVFRAADDTNGRIFYNETMDGFNFERTSGNLVDVLRVLESGAADSDYCYIGSTPVDHHLPGIREQNTLALGKRQPLVSLWLGNRTRIAAHFDLPENLACVVAGRRRFTLFPPDQVGNLYPGPLDFNPAGQAISMVDFYAPDYQRFPRFREALAAAQVAEMAPGDVLYVPSMWWHQVEGLDEVNMLINYWWRSTEAWSGLPQDALMHALLSIGGLPESQRRAWGSLFTHFVVHRAQAVEHIPQARRGILANLDKSTAGRLKKLLQEKLQRTP